jgi:hypothetical protein
MKTKKQPARERMPVFTVEEFKERIKAICGLNPAGYYNAPAEPDALTRRTAAVDQAEQTRKNNALMLKMDREREARRIANERETVQLRNYLAGYNKP